MRCLLRGRWTDGVLDAWRGPHDYRIRIEAFVNLEPIADLYFVRALHPRLVWNYLRQIGPVMIWRKVASRLQERDRNEKWVSLGAGTVLEAPPGAAFPPGSTVAFLAPSHPACLERIVLPPELMARLDPAVDITLHPDAVLYHRRHEEGEGRSVAWWTPVRGWSAASGLPIPTTFAQELEKSAAEALQRLDWSRADRLPVSPQPSVAEIQARPHAPEPGTKPRAVLFGYGHYAKTIIRPNVSEALTVEAVHELDPTQIPLDGAGISYWDTSPEPRGDERHDVYLIAGFHHTHAPLAVSALQRGAYAVSEKPVAVNRSQLGSLLAAAEASERGLFACFHKRYSPLNAFALRDIGLRPGAPIDYHCIVYEVPLPELHWYRWPNSKSRLVSNGCHWIDHFLYLNGFSEVLDSAVFLSPNGTINCSIVLRNGAVFTMVLTEKGSDRIGLQDHVELRASRTTVTITNNTDYLAENRTRIVRRIRVNKTHTYHVMYQEIARRIARNEGADSLESIRISTGLILDLEEKLDACVAARGAKPELRQQDSESINEAFASHTRRS